MYMYFLAIIIINNNYWTQFSQINVVISQCLVDHLFAEAE